MAFRKRCMGFILAMVVSLFFLVTSSCVPARVQPPKRSYRPPASAFNQGKMRYESGDYASALTFFLKATKADPANWLPYNWLAWTYYNLKRYDDAIVQFNIANNFKQVHGNYLGLGELTSYLSEQVRRETRNAQSPTISGRYDPALSIGK